MRAAAASASVRAVRESGRGARERSLDMELGLHLGQLGARKDLREREEEVRRLAREKAAKAEEQQNAALAQQNATVGVTFHTSPCVSHPNQCATQIMR